MEPCQLYIIPSSPVFGLSHEENIYMNSQYFFARVRTSKKYFAFLLLQLLLSLFVVIVAFI
jgi:hypothetical protein